MPRRLPVRPAKVFGNFFVLIVLCLMGFIYYTYIFVVWGPRAENDPRICGLLIFYNVIFFMLLWSFFQTMTTDPGQVPVFWGFHLGDNENKRRRYCLMCNVFKPERCHHCSACNRCVLNMDHHCPWINNCVGFWNRKFFLLLLFYVLIITYLTFFTMAWDFYKALEWGFDSKFIDKNDVKLRRNSFIMIAFMFNTIVCVLMTAFLKFHIKLALENKTTIENLDKQGQPYVSQYDIGEKENWRQIFGTNPWIWPFPMYLSGGKPVGDGIYWQTSISLQQMNPHERAKNANSGPPGPATAGRTPRETNFASMGPNSHQYRQFGSPQMHQFSRDKVGSADDHSRQFLPRSKSPPESGVTPSTQHTSNPQLSNQLGPNQNIFNNTLISKRQPSPQGVVGAAYFSTPGGSYKEDSLNGRPYQQQPYATSRQAPPAIHNHNSHYSKALQMQAQIQKKGSAANLPGQTFSKTSPSQSLVKHSGAASQKSLSQSNSLNTTTVEKSTNKKRQMGSGGANHQSASGLTTTHKRKGKSPAPNGAAASRNQMKQSSSGAGLGPQKSLSSAAFR